MDLTILFFTILPRGTGFLFTFSGASKVVSRDLFLNTLQSIPWMPALLAKIISHALPWFEIILGTFLITGSFHNYTPYFSLFMLLIFNILIIVLIKQKVVISCSCFGQFSREQVSIRTFYRNIFIGLFTLPLLTSQPFIDYSLDYIIDDFPYKNIEKLILLCSIAVIAIGFSFLISIVSKSLAKTFNHSMNS